ncbi:MAG: hypothetical protein LQ340_003800, partial [Diploschistes diacapsis]
DWRARFSSADIELETGDGAPVDLLSAPAFGGDGTFDTRSSSTAASRATSVFEHKRRAYGRDGKRMSEDTEELLYSYRALAKGGPWDEIGSTVERVEEGDKENRAEKLHLPTPKKMARLPLRLAMPFEMAMPVPKDHGGKRMQLPVFEFEKLFGREREGARLPAARVVKGTAAAAVDADLHSHSAEQGQAIDKSKGKEKRKSIDVRISSGLNLSPRAAERSTSRIPKPVVGLRGATAPGAIKGYGEGKCDPLTPPPSTASECGSSTYARHETQTSSPRGWRKGAQYPNLSPQGRSAAVEERYDGRDGTFDRAEKETEREREKGLKVVLTMDQDVEDVVRIEVHPSPGSRERVETYFGGGRMVARGRGIIPASNNK